MTDIYHDGYGSVELIRHMGSDQAIIDSARVSYAGDTSEWRPEADPKLLRYLIKNKHWSPLECCTLTWHFVVPLFVARQHHRHRTWAVNEISRRYTSEDIEFYCPPEFRLQAKSNKQASDWDFTFDPKGCYLDYQSSTHMSQVVADHAKRSMELYEAMLDEGIAREQARMVLPQNMYTRYYGTVNLRNALAFIELREDAHAQWEIYKVAEVMRVDLTKLFPETMKAWADTRNGGL
jgi:thymidylate synthase (FAD)